MSAFHEIGSLILVLSIGVLAILSFFGSSSDNERKRQLESRNKNKEDAEAEITLLTSALNNSDVGERFEILLSYYSWADLLHSLPIGSLELGLLEEVGNCEGPLLLDLPNPSSKYPTKSELRELKLAARAAKEDSLMEGQPTLDLVDYFQVSSTRTLESLKRKGLVSVEPDIDAETREYTTTISLMGRRLLELHAEYSSTVSNTVLIKNWPRTDLARSLLHQAWIDTLSK